MRGNGLVSRARSRSLGIALLATFAAIGSCHAGEGIEVGLIESINGPADHYALRRGAEQTAIPVQPGGRLMNGDRIEVKSESDRLVIWLFQPGSAKKSVVVLSHSDGIYLVEGQRPIQGLSQQLSALWQWAANELGLQDVEGSEKAIAEASVREIGGFSVPLLNNVQMLAAGHRAITIGWPRFDGTVRVTIKGPDHRVVARGKASSRQWTSRPIALDPGSYTLVIEPVSGPKIEKKLAVVPASALPKFPEDPAAAQLPPDLVETIRAVWLAGQARGRYALEAFQTVNPIAERYHPAKVLSRTLIEGLLPSQPPSI